ncbi:MULTISPECIES: response regulator [unclassified Anabaena]|uniref:response regulator n=1 Tax=unclassified Anabaena TaxID=2619674 RepID=UPI0039C7549C
MRILVVEDDELNSYVLSAILSNQNYAVEVAHDGDIAWDLIETYDYDLILSDIMLPKLDGISLCRKIRSSGRQMPVLLLTGCNSSHEKAIGLDAGADDYVVKPFEQEELVARVRALLRRSGTTVQPILEWGNLQLDPSSCEVHYADNLLSLTPKEYALLELFLRNHRRVFSCGMILEHLWSYEDTPGEEAVRTHIKGLRQKLKAVGAPSDLIETVYGIGYRLKQQEDEAQKSQEVEQPKTKKSQPPQELPTPEQTLTAIAGIWQKFQGRVDEQVRIIEQAIALIQTGLKLSDMHERVSPAIKEAHTLAGSLGTFGLPEGSRLARQIEQLLKSNQPWQPDDIADLQNWIKLLRQEITAKADSTTNLPKTPAELPGDGTLKNNLAQAEAKILAVDDDPQILALLQTLLPPWGLQVITLNDPRQFWETLTTVAPDLLILDIEMPHIGGLELCQEVRHDPSWSELPILFLTVHSDAEILNQVFSVGADDFVNKPIIGPELVTRIINRLERVKLLRRVSQKVGSEGQGDKNDDASPSPSSAISREITQYQEIEAEIQRVNRTLQTLSSCNQAIIRATQENDLLKKICQVLVEIGGYRLAWVGFAENDPEKNILSVAQAGYEDGYLQSLNLTWSDTVNGQGPTGTAIRTSEISIIQNISLHPKYEIWRCQANQRGYAASIALPLKADGKAFGALSIYAGEPNAFDADEVKLLDELGENLSSGIVALRNQRDCELLQKNGQLAEAALQQANNELELRVAERTAELVNVNRQLQSQLNERQRIEEILRISQVRLARILDIADDAIISIDSSQCITLFNQGAEKIFGYAAHEIIGQKLDVLLPMRFAEAHRHHVVDFGQSPSLARRMGERREIFGRRQDETEFPAEASISKFHLGDDFFYTVILRDITERKQIDRMKDEFVSVVSHELRTPLTSIHGSLGMLASGLLKPDSPQGQRLLQIATDSTERLVRLINDILDIERIESGKVKMAQTTCNLAELIHSAVSLMQPLSHKAQVTLSISSSPLQIWADPDRIVQTLTNLLSNAIKFSSAGSKVSLTTQQQGDEILVIIQDTGRGIPTDKLESIFERFQQVDSSDSRNHDGTGLGLAICQSIVQQHGGRIWAESVLGEGSTFYLALPILSAETTAKLK